uniref:CAB/ELIP/HLIP superfamily protein n=1 Tax=Rhodella violacea TaxID=2801 RepID=UPI001FCDC8BC|nr:CAB/ELIP/HLIP superfamily protein [Rhodella violacea]UNJ18112.1 CAB/ELIP/HLIP superfamily protein [Rhodella violacea]
MKKNNRNIWEWGFTSGAENWNGRLAMLGFILALLLEIFTSKGILFFLGFIQ